jgi:hypothetical protein
LFYIRRICHRERFFTGMARGHPKNDIKYVEEQCMFLQHSNGQLPSEKPFDQVMEEGDLLARNLKFLVDNTLRIVQDPRLYHCRLYFGFLSLPRLGSWQIPLGRLVPRWQRGRLMAGCPRCGGRACVVGGCGLFGAFRWWGACPDCRALVRGRGHGPKLLWQLIEARVGAEASTGPRPGLTVSQALFRLAYTP